jgi:hypothetical protein
MKKKQMKKKKKRKREGALIWNTITFMHDGRMSSVWCGPIDHPDRPISLQSKMPSMNSSSRIITTGTLLVGPALICLMLVLCIFLHLWRESKFSTLEVWPFLIQPVNGLILIEETAGFPTSPLLAVSFWKRVVDIMINDIF